MIVDEETQPDTYSVWVPIEDNDLMKSIEIDENGDYIVQGVMTTDNSDEEDDEITPEGMDCSFFLQNGWVKYEHGVAPSQFIGEPLEVKIGQFIHPTRHELVKGIFVKAKLFAQRKLAQEAIQTMQDLQKSTTKRCMGWSIEGSVKERNRKTGKITKSILRNVVLTLTPVNTMTFAELAKSFAKNHELTIDMEKSMDTAGAAAIMPQSLEGAKPDPQEKWMKLFKKFCRNNFLQKSLRDKFVAGSPGSSGMMSYTFALEGGLDNEEAFKFASYISDRHDILKSLFSTKFGGGTVAKAAGTLAGLLDADLEELRKSLEIDTEEDLEKSQNKKKDGTKGHEDKETDEEEEDEHESGGDEEGEDEEDEKTEKAIRTDFVKSLASNDENAQALEVSDFLFNLSEEIGYSMDGFAKSLTQTSKQQAAVTKALMTTVDLLKSLSEKVDGLQTENTELKKSLNHVLNLPLGRKGAVNQREITTLTKSIEGQGPLTRKQAGDILMKSFEAHEIPGMTVSRFEAGVGLESLNLPDSVKTKLGL